MKTPKTNATLLAAAIAVFNQSAAFAGGTHAGGDELAAGIGTAGSDQIDRVIHVDMGEMFFSLDELEVEANETIRFVIRNAGDFVHEFNLGTERMHAAHESEMLAMMDRGILEADRINHRKMKAAKMMHDDPKKRAT